MFAFASILMIEHLKKKRKCNLWNFEIFLKGSELMKFTKGYWMNKPGVTNADAVQVTLNLLELVQNA